MRKIIVDCDPGHDDVVALLIAFANEEKLKIEAITTVGGNQVLEKVTRNALSVCALTNRKIKVGKGEPGPLTRELMIAEEAHGDLGINGPKEIPEPTFQIEKQHAVEVIKNILEESNEKITIVALAPLTNLAKLFIKYPQVKEKIEAISLMGGGVYEGNATCCSEFNILVDPEAAQIVFQSGIPIIMSGLDVTHKAQMYIEEIEEIRGYGKVSTFFAEMMDFYIKGSYKFGFDGCPLHDPCAMIYLLKPEIFKGKEALVNIETKGEFTTGMTVADFRSPIKNTKILMDVNRKEFVKFIKGCIKKLDDEQV